MVVVMNEFNFEEEVMILEEAWTNSAKRVKEIDKVKDMTPLICDEAYLQGFEWYGTLKKGEWVQYKGGRYFKKMDDVFSLLINKCLRSVRILKTDAYYRIVEGNMKDLHNCKGYVWDKDPRIINYTNGLLSTKTWILEPHRRDYKSFNQRPWDYHPKGNCPEFLAILDMACCESPDPFLMKNQLMEAIGLCLTTDINMGKNFIILSVEGTTMKSPILYILSMLCGDENYSMVSFQHLVKGGKKAMASIAYKNLNYKEELDKEGIKKLGTAKDFLNCKRFTYEEKFKEDRKCRNMAKHFFACQDLPYVPDLDTAFCKRFCIWLFTHKVYSKGLYNKAVKKGKIDPKKIKWIKVKKNFKRKPSKTYEGIYNSHTGEYERVIKGYDDEFIINNKPEMEGIISCAMTALKNLYERGEFVDMDEETIFDIWQKRNDYVAKFVFAHCRILSNQEWNNLKDFEYIERNQMHEYFLHYLDINGFKEKYSLNEFTRKLKVMGYITKQRFISNSNELKQKSIRVYERLTINEAFRDEYILDTEL